MGWLPRLLALVAAILLLGTAAGPTPVAAAPADPSGEVVLQLFWGDGCPHCAAEKEWLEQAVEDHPGLVVEQFEVWGDADNQQLFLRTADELGFEPSGVPTTVIGERYWVGWSDTVRDEIAAEVERTLSAGTDPVPTDQPSTASVDVPLVGPVEVGSGSLVLSTLVIGFVDGVNPCSLWVISVLLAIVVRSASRRRVLLVGSTFLAVTAAMYAAYMAGIYSAMGVIGHLGAVQVVVAVVAGVFGAINVKDYVAFRKGVSLTIPESSKPGIYARVRTAAGRRELLPALGATVVLAVAVSLLETPCTAGFPVLWTGLLEANGVSTAQAAGLFGLYMAPFLLDELVVFGLAVATMRATKVQERHGRLLKLVAGTLMLALAGTVLVAPEAMTRPATAALVFAGAFATAGAVHLVTRAVRGDPWSSGEPSQTSRRRPTPVRSRR
ncbi:membrane protein [Fodinibacter luteus]|uniref:Membrane protein n=1 Tax=Fodinibacter luteus TaxID=552064 RepID=A0ABP8JXP9_9MICO